VRIPTEPRAACGRSKGAAALERLETPSSTECSDSALGMHRRRTEVAVTFQFPFDNSYARLPERFYARKASFTMRGSDQAEHPPQGKRRGSSVRGA
jgi:hypothetical protein